ncbi:MAG: immunoglobulin domain-containing protein, partial [Dehalococcoidia bacterium]|nr:immunoglobulin domain-containing protein [Dehalococcoidia bacterium]
TFTVVATGTAPLTYQWRKDNVDLVDSAGHIAGATTATLTITDALLTDAGSYTVVVTNQVTNVTSAAATLTVNALVAPVLAQPRAA